MVGRLAQYVAHFCYEKLSHFEAEPPNSSKVDDILKPDEGQDDLKNATKVLEMFKGTVNPVVDEQIPELEGRKRGGEVNEPLPSEPKLKVLIILEVGCYPSKNMPLLGGNLITNVKVKGGPLIANKSPRHRATGLRTLDNSLDDPMEPDRFTQHRWKQYHRWPPPF